MIYQLPNGRVIEMSMEQYLDLDDQDVSELVGLNPAYSSEVSNAFFKKFTAKPANDDENHEVEPNLLDVNGIDKLNDRDFHRDDN